MNDTTNTTTAKSTRERAFTRSYDYSAFTGAVKDATSGAPMVEFDLSTFPESVRNKLALSGLMALVAKEMVEAHNDGEDAAVAGSEVVADLQADKVEFRDGVGVAMGGALKRVARALIDLGFTKAKAPNGTVLTWTAGDLAGAHAAMKTLWDMAEKVEQDGVIASGPHTGKPRMKMVYESGKTRFNKIKASPEVAAKLLSYAKKPSGVELS